MLTSLTKRDPKETTKRLKLKFEFFTHRHNKIQKPNAPRNIWKQASKARAAPKIFPSRVPARHSACSKPLLTISLKPRVRAVVHERVVTPKRFKGERYDFDKAERDGRVSIV